MHKGKKKLLGGGLFESFLSREDNGGKRKRLEKYSPNSERVSLCKDNVSGQSHSRSPTLRSIARNESDHNTKIFYNWKNTAVQHWWLGSVATFHQQSDHTNRYSTFTASYCGSVHLIFPRCPHFAGLQKGIHGHSGLTWCCWCNWLESYVYGRVMSINAATCISWPTITEMMKAEPSPPPPAWWKNVNSISMWISCCVSNIL